MKFLVTLTILLALAAADASHRESQVPIVKDEYEINPDNSYQYNYETGNGINAQEQGSLMSVNNKFLVTLTILLALAAADASHRESQVPIVKDEYEINPDNSYQYNYETGNGINAQEQGSLKSINNEYPSISVNGGFKYNSPEGPVELTYVADENGFQPKGAHLPVGPAIPEYILRSIEYIRTHAPK